MFTKVHLEEHDAIDIVSLIKGRETINRWLNQKIVIGQEKNYCNILTNDEEEGVVTFLKNKDRCIQAINMKDLEKMIF